MQEAALYSDAMDGDFIPRIAPLFTGKVFSSRELGESLSPLLLEDIGQLPGRWWKTCGISSAPKNFNRTNNPHGRNGGWI